MAADIPKMTLWYYPHCRSLRCAWIIKELGLDEYVEYKFVPIFPPRLRPRPEREEYRKNVHPHSTIPALEMEGRPTMLESTAICMYLADLCGRLVPETKDRAEYYDWILYAASRLDEVMEILTYQWLFRPMLNQGQDPEAITKAKATADLCMEQIDNVLKYRLYILGSELSAADCVLGFNVIWAAMPEMDGGSLLEGRPHVKKYLERIKARPALQETFKLHELDSES